MLKQRRQLKAVLLGLLLPFMLVTAQVAKASKPGLPPFVVSAREEPGCPRIWSSEACSWLRSCNNA